eukprot:TRINITY_DN2992_c0_g1_i1.p1 TRINITY_DN2992_c0_g1~~TRINITY_DN2992_c0_g1_i1.p1  ORF type:complete len:2417 (-),score=391.69 TRINITY_DN2992_c0_g1_i1:75-7325(-)
MQRPCTYWWAIVALLSLSFLVTDVAAAKAASCSIDFVGVEPLTYDHSTGGGAYNSGSGSDVNEGNLQGGDYTCNDIVSFFQQITCDDGAIPTGGLLQVELEFDAYLPSENVAYSNVRGISANHGLVENGKGTDANKESCSTSGGAGVFGYDCGHKGNRNEVVTLTDEWMTRPIFTKQGGDSSLLKAIYTVTGVEDDEVIIVRIDVQIACVPTVDGAVNGNLGARLVSQTGFDASGNDFSLGNVGNQNVPMSGLADLVGIKDCYFALESPPLTGVEFTADVIVEDAATNGGAIGAEFAYSWEHGAWLISADSSNALELHTFDTECTNDHDGEYLYAEGDCGEDGSAHQCEETFIGANQAQLFYDSASEYYLEGVDGGIINGKFTTLYLPNPDYWAPQAVTALYLETSTGNIVRSEWENGRVMTYNNVVYLDVQEGVFVRPDGCVCRRNLNVIIMIDVADTTGAQVTGGVRTYLKALVADYDHELADFGVYEYDDVSVYELQSLADSGNTIAATNAALGTTSSSGLSSGTGDVAMAINNALPRFPGGAGREDVLIIVTNGWQQEGANTGSTDSAVASAVAAARSQLVTVMTVMHESFMFPEDTVAIQGTNPPEPDNLLWYWTTEQLGLSDPVALNSRVCLLDSTPCGAECCGYCDSACGTGGCRPLDSCPDTGDCTYNYVLTVEGCCELREEPYCADPGNLNPCEQLQCNAVTGQCELVTCADNDNACYSYTCNEVTNQCVETEDLPPSTTCSSPSCDESNGDYRVVWGPSDTAINCGPDTACHTYECVEGTGCVETAEPTPATGVCERPPTCDPVDGWSSEPVTCNSTPCAPSECTVDSNNECVTTLLCQPDSSDKCDLNSCVDGQCTNEVKQCPPVNCQVSHGCNPDTGYCVYTPLSCADGECEVKECNEATGQCEITDSSPCDICPNDCNNNACQTTPCERTVCQEDQTVHTECVPDDECFVATCDDLEGCVQTAVVCDEPLSSVCVRWVTDPNHPGCCREATINCDFGDTCTNYSCDDVDGCQADPIVCTPPPCMDIDPAFSSTGGCDNGQCKYVDRTCVTNTCETRECDPDVGSEGTCVVLNYDQCECSCGNTECHAADCVQGVCGEQVPVDCEAQVQHVCEELIECDDQQGCIIEPVVCEGTPDPCMEWYQDPAHPTTCCHQRAIQCPNNGCEVEECVTDVVAQGECTVVDRSACPCPTCTDTACLREVCSYNADLVDHECVQVFEESCAEDAPDNCHVNPTCDDVDGCQYEVLLCDETPDPCFEYVRTPSHADGQCCRQVPVVCTDDDRDPAEPLCAQYECVVTGEVGECAVISREACPCDPPCVNDLCEKNRCMYDAVSLQPYCERTETTVCADQIPDTCHENPTCDPVLGCQFDTIECSATQTNCQYEEADPTVDGCCVTKDVVCAQPDCNVYECRTDNTPAGECLITDTSGCQCDPATCVNNLCVKSLCTQGVCGEPVDTECTATDICHENPRCELDGPGDGCVEDEVVCPEAPPCQEYFKDVNAADGVCCQLRDIVCAEPGCEAMTCDLDSASPTLGECIEANRDNCPCDLDRHIGPDGCLVNNVCQSVLCVDGECSEPELTTCEASDFCHENARCDATQGGCIEDEVVCEPASACQQLVRSPGVEGCCVYEDIVCESGCEVNECDLDVDSPTYGECVEVNRDACPCDQPRHIEGEDACLVNNACVKTLCVGGECSEPLLTNCTATNFCFENARCDVLEGGCVEDPVDCGEPAPCTTWERNPSVEGCCVAKPVECLNPGCEELWCDPEDTETTNMCVVLNTDACKCTCDNNACQSFTCDDGTCVGPTLTDCSVVPNGDTCKTTQECSVELGGCVYPEVECAPAPPCQTLRRDSTVEGCCVYEDIVCPADGTVSDADLCSVYTGECFESECLTRPVTCEVPSCKLVHPDFVESNGCDADTGLCRTVSNKCTEENENTCEVFTCVPSESGPGECLLDHTDNCDICSPPCLNNKCFKSLCLQQNCTEPVATECNAVDFCHVPSCDLDLGCINTPIDCAEFNVENPLGPCEFYVKDPENPDCCVVTQRTCDNTDACYGASECNAETGKCEKIDYLCDALSTDCVAGVCGADGCEVSPRATHTCPAQEDLCKVPICTDTFECAFEDVVCTPKNLCNIATCDSATGTCNQVRKTCDDSIPCTVDTCVDATGECSHVDKVCGDPANLCEVGSCNAETGACFSEEVSCDDGFSCTRDSCDPATGCVNAINELSEQDCALRNPCKLASCNPEHENADPVTGCAFDLLECTVSDNYCTYEECVDFEGCVVQQVDCRAEHFNYTVDAGPEEGEDVPVAGEDDCDLHRCDTEDGGMCVVEERACVAPFGTALVVTTAVVGTAAVVGIVVGIVVAVALCAGGAGVYSVYKNVDDGATAVVANNPLYDAANYQFENPLFHT